MWTGFRQASIDWPLPRRRASALRRIDGLQRVELRRSAIRRLAANCSHTAQPPIAVIFDGGISATRRQTPAMRRAMTPLLNAPLHGMFGGVPMQPE